jgi:hypothetical protein
MKLIKRIFNTLLTAFSPVPNVVTGSYLERKRRPAKLIKG